MASRRAARRRRSTAALLLRPRLHPDARTRRAHASASAALVKWPAVLPTTWKHGSCTGTIGAPPMH
eukprot:14992288-Alexandrium_andersonii.AAC.1